jgi:hypothetical protein
MENQTDELYGKIFDEVPLLSEEHLEIIIESMSNQEAIYFLTMACKSAFHRGAFSLGESEIISKAIRITSKPQILEKNIDKDDEVTQ